MNRFVLSDRPLSVQIWVILGIILGFSVVLLALLVSLSLNRSFTNEIFSQIEESQEFMLKYRGDLPPPERPPPPNRREGRPPHFRVPRHVFFDSGQELTIPELTPGFIQVVKRDALAQQEVSKRYARKSEDRSILYVIRRLESDGEMSYLISYVWGGYREALVFNVLRRSLPIIVFVLLMAWIASMVLSKHLTKPLTDLQDRVKEIAERKWETPVSLDRNDEIGSLAQTIEWMRCRLNEHNREQQAFLQKVSHELKTPVMVIRSYAQAIRDGIFPCGNLENSLSVIEGEAERLERRVRSLLHLSKLEYLSSRSLERSKVDLPEVVNSVAGRFGWRRTELDWDLQLEPVVIHGNRDALLVALENLFDNQLRYAKERIQVDLSRGSTCGRDVVLLRVWNDGPPIEADIMQNLFAEFKKGSDGEFGLGLAIVKMIVDAHEGRIWAANEDGGAGFYIEFPAYASK